MKVFKTAIILALALSILFQGTLFSADRQKEFNEIGKMDLKQLTFRAKAVLDKKYLGENWEQYKFPKYVYIHDAVQTAYKIAVKNPELLAKFPCYCFCEPMGHKNLAYCFLEKGVAKGKFDDHASTCNICVTQAMQAFLWNEIGAPVEEMQEAMKQMYGK
jgi:hypothetical protein